MNAQKMQWVAVRCCCKPQKVMGFLLLAEKQLRHPNICVFGTNGPEQLQIAQMYDGMAVELAIKSEDRTIEFWRTVKGFIEASAPSPGVVKMLSADFLDGLRA